MRGIGPRKRRRGWHDVILGCEDVGIVHELGKGCLFGRGVRFGLCGGGKISRRRRRSCRGLAGFPGDTDRRGACGGRCGGRPCIRGRVVFGQPLIGRDRGPPGDGLGGGLGYDLLIGRYQRCTQLGQVQAYRLPVTVQRIAPGKMRCLTFGRSKKWLARELAGFGYGHEGHRREIVFLGKALCLVKGQAGDDCDLHDLALARPVEHQFLGPVGCAPFQCGGNLGAAAVAIGPGGGDVGEKNLTWRQHKLGPEPAGRNRQRAGPQRRHVGGKIALRRIDRPQMRPSLRRSSKKVDPFVGQGKRKFRFHALRLPPVRGRRNGRSALNPSKAEIRPRKADTPRNGLPRASKFRQSLMTRRRFPCASFP